MNHFTWGAKTYGESKFQLFTIEMMISKNWTEFTALDQWERGYHSYKCIMQLDVFHQVHHPKFFILWSKHFIFSNSIIQTHEI
jgi:hypothetical protein